MKLIADIADERLTLDVRRAGARVMAEIDGRHYELEAREPEPGVHLLVYDGRVYECRVDAAGTSAPERARREVRIGEQAYRIALFDPKRLRGATSVGAHAGGRAEVVAPMPGKVVRVLVAEGATVEAGDGLVVVEAMKMQNELKSPKAGTIVALYAQAGATVNAGDVLLVVE